MRVIFRIYYFKEGKTFPRTKAEVSLRLPRAKSNNPEFLIVFLNNEVSARQIKFANANKFTKSFRRYHIGDEMILQN